MEPHVVGSKDAGLRVHDRRSVLCDQAERNKRTGAWVEEVNLMYPHWDGADTQDQKTVLNDVKTEPPVQDRCKKRMLEDKQSALSPKAKKCPYYKELQFLLKTPRVKTIEEHPEVWDRASEEYKGSYTKGDAWPAIVTEIDPQCPQLPKAGQKLIMADVKKRWRSVTDRLIKSSAMSEAGPSSSSAVEVASMSTDAASGAASSSAGGVSRPTGMGAGSAHPVTLRRAAPKKGKKIEASTSVIEILTSRTLNLIYNSSQEDELDKFGSFLAGRLRSMPRDRQGMYMTAASVLLTALDVPYPIPPPAAIMTGIMNIFNPQSVPPPPPAAALQRFGQAAAYRPDAAEAHSYGCPPAPPTGHHAMSPNSMFSQDLIPGYGYKPEYQQF